MEDDVTKDLSEFSLANAIYAALVESHACEQSARRNAMDNASKNATDMISRLQMQYNRGRQAAITNELVDIITGAFLTLLYVLAYFFVLEVRLMHGVIFVFLSQVQVLCRRSCGFRQSVYVHWIFIIDPRKHSTGPKVLTFLSTPSGVLMSR